MDVLLYGGIGCGTFSLALLKHLQGEGDLNIVLGLQHLLADVLLCSKMARGPLGSKTSRLHSEMASLPSSKVAVPSKLT